MQATSTHSFHNRGLIRGVSQLDNFRSSRRSIEYWCKSEDANNKWLHYPRELNVIVN
jgi:hypothetical protein